MIIGFFFYIVECSDKSYYIGHTDDLGKRINEHNTGFYSTYTTKRLPVKLVYYELFNTRDEAFAAEHKVKKWSRRKKEILIKEGWLGFLKR